MKKEAGAVGAVSDIAREVRFLDQLRSNLVNGLGAAHAANQRFFQQMVVSLRNMPRGHADTACETIRWRCAQAIYEERQRRKAGDAFHEERLYAWTWLAEGQRDEALPWAQGAIWYKLQSLVSWPQSINDILQTMRSRHQGRIDATMLELTLTNARDIGIELSNRAETLQAQEGA